MPFTRCACGHFFCCKTFARHFVCIESSLFFFLSSNWCMHAQHMCVIIFMSFVFVWSHTHQSQQRVKLHLLNILCDRLYDCKIVTCAWISFYMMPAPDFISFLEQLYFSFYYCNSSTFDDSDSSTEWYTHACCSSHFIGFSLDSKLSGCFSNSKFCFDRYCLS